MIGIKFNEKEFEKCLNETSLIHYEVKSVEYDFYAVRVHVKAEIIGIKKDYISLIPYGYLGCIFGDYEGVAGELNKQAVHEMLKQKQKNIREEKENV